MSELNLRLIRYFAVVAETGHVGVAAERLGISQSPLSRQLRVLEADLGVNLFDRSGKRLRLSSAGERFLPDAHKILKQAKLLQRSARHLGRGGPDGLRIGYVKNAIGHGPLLPAVNRFRSRHPEAEIELYNRYSSVQMEMLLRRELDVGFGHWSATRRELQSDCVLREPFLLAAPAGHAVLAKATLQPGDLDGASWILMDRKFDVTAHEQLTTICRGAGFSPDFRYEVPDLQVALQFVAAGLGFAFVPRGIPLPNPERVELRHLPWLRFDLAIFATRLRTHSNPQLEEFIELLRNEERLARGAGVRKR